MKTIKINKAPIKITILLMTAFILLNTINCDSVDDLMNFPLENIITADFIKYTIRIEKSVFEVGESINVDFIIKNIGFKKMDVGLSTISSDFEISVKKENELVFYWPQTVWWACSSLTLKRRESKEYSFTWDSKNNIYDSLNYGQYVSPGIYTVTMGLMSYTHRCPGVSVNINIKY